MEVKRVLSVKYSSFARALLSVPPRLSWQSVCVVIDTYTHLPERYFERQENTSEVVELTPFDAGNGEWVG